MRSQSRSTEPLVSLRYQCRAIASSRGVKYGVGLYEKKEEKKGEEEKDADLEV